MQTKGPRHSLQDLGTFWGFIRRISQGIYIVTPDGEILDANPALVEIFGAGSLDELRRYRSKDLVPDDAQRAARRKLLTEQGWLRNFEYQIRRLDGEIRTVRDTVFAQHDDDGEILVMHGIITDVTDEDKEHAAPGYEETPWGSFFAGAPAGLAILDRNLCFVRVNETLATLLRLPVIDHIGRRLDDVVPGLAPTVQPILQHVLDTGHPAMDFEISVSGEVTPAEVRYWRFSAFPVGPVHGAPNAVGVIVVDVTGARRIEQEVRFDKRYLLAMIENHPLAIAVVDAANRVLSVNHAFERLFQHRRDEITGHDIDELLAPAEAVEEARQLTQRTQLGERLRFEGRRLRADGSALQVGIHTIPIVLDGELVGAYGIYQELAEGEHED